MPVYGRLPAQDPARQTAPGSALRAKPLPDGLDLIALTAIVFYRLRDKPVAEASLYNGVFYRFAHSHLTWFITDVLVCFFAVGFSGVVWRVSTVINLGIPTYALVALVIALVNSLINSLFGLPRVAWKSASPTYIIDLGLSVGVTMFLLWAVTRLWLTEPWIPFSMIWLIGRMLLCSVAVRYRERLFTGIANRWLIMREAMPLSPSAS